MIEADRERFARLMATLAEVYGEASVLKQQAYWMALFRFEWADVEFAAMRCLETRTSSGGFPASWPTPADLRLLMWNDLDATPDAPKVSGRKALPEPRADPAVVRANLEAVKELLGQTSQRMPKLPTVRNDSEDPYRGGGLTWIMQEKNWRARWDLYRRDPEYKPLADAIPERLRLKFAVEDEAAKGVGKPAAEETPY